MGKINVMAAIAGFLMLGTVKAALNDQYAHVECFSASKSEIDSFENRMIYNGKSSFESVTGNIDAVVDFRTADSAIVRISDTKKDQDILFSTQFNENGLFQARSYSLNTTVTCHKF